jgi:ABC-type arginine transport system permease subunit
LGLVSGAYGTEVLRGAVLAVPRGQSDAARAVGLSRARVFFLVVLPQAWRIALPGLGNLWMTMLKETALVSVIGLQDLVREAGLAAASTRQPFPFFAAVALGYLVLTALSMVAMVRLERHVHRGYEPAQAG